MVQLKLRMARHLRLPFDTGNSCSSTKSMQSFRFKGPSKPWSSRHFLSYRHELNECTKQDFKQWPFQDITLHEHEVYRDHSTTFALYSKLATTKLATGFKEKTRRLQDWLVYAQIVVKMLILPPPSFFAECVKEMSKNASSTSIFLLQPQASCTCFAMWP